MRRAFTLLEVVLALAVSALVMFGCATTLFQLLETAERIGRGWSLREHADGVERFLNSTFGRSLILHPSRIENIYAQNASKTVAIAELPESLSTQKTVVFEVNENHPLFLSCNGFAPEKICWLKVGDGGMSIVWRQANAEEKNSDAILYETKISPFAKSISYIYQDNDNWREEDEPDDTAQTAATGNSSMPYLIKIRFERNGETLERIIPLYGNLDPNLQ